MQTNQQRPDTDVEDRLTSLVEGLRSDLRSTYTSLKRSAYVEWQFVQCRIIDAIFRAGLYLCLAGFCTAASIAAALLIAHGIRVALVAWTRTEWIGSIGAGVATLALVIGVGVTVRTWLRKDHIRKAERAIAQTERKELS